MGIVDSIRVRLTCQKCGATDVIRAVQKGSGYGFGSWDDFSDSSLFDVQSQRGVDSPDVTAATCKRCKVASLVTDLGM